ncbi:DUF6527 family protein [Salinibacillus xinjiangensis]|uniref:Ammonia monooxygenase n=1 Tax=Salinibacillus xinjiangensis TaxID=1229268 RepID=A0A6G1X7X9_9BACI|nr:DUF6527 family protein [Salinibacillus xinjiangensis]MRG87016.1 ammonia monooxygenase [Salinibacillus xinjiangensis]
MKVRKTNDERYLFYCEGCENCHGINDSWSFNGDYDNPTFSPSVLVRGTRPITDGEYDRLISGEKIEPEKFVCHSFIRNGEIQYLNDCTHKLAGKTVDLLDENYWFED